MAENERDAKSTLEPFYKEFERAVNLGQMALKQAWTNFFWKHSSGNPVLLRSA